LTIQPRFYENADYIIFLSVISYTIFSQGDTISRSWKIFLKSWEVKMRIA